MPTPPRLRARSGVTLAEVIVALVIVAVGLLGIAGSSALMLRAVSAQAAEHRAVSQAALRLAELTAGGCPNARSGSVAHPRGMHESWQVGAAGENAILLQDSLEWIAGGRTRRLVVRGGMTC